MLSRRAFLGGAVALGAATTVKRVGARETPQSPQLVSPGWTPLFNGKDLDGWYTHLRDSGKNDPKRYVRVENGQIHIMAGDIVASPAEAGYLATTREYSNYRVRVEYKWGEQRFAPRLENKRDNGLLYHLVGEDKVWPTCVECQIQETDTGDIFLLGGTRGIHGSLTGAGNRGAGAGNAGAAQALEPTGGRKIKEGDFEKLTDWNVVEVIVDGDRSTHIVNGRIVNRLNSIQQPDALGAGRFVSLTRGKIALEIEYAEIWYRRVEIKAL